MNRWTSSACSGSRRFTRADRPHRFVGNHDLFHLFLAYPFQPAFQLPLDDRKGLSSSLSLRVSPMQKMGLKPWFRAAFILLLTVSSVSPKNCLLSEWPMITYWQPRSLSIKGDISPCKGPLLFPEKVLSCETNGRALTSLSGQRKGL